MFPAMKRHLGLGLLLVGAISSAACGVATSKYEGVVADLKKCQDERTAEKDRLAQLEKQLGDVTLERDKASAHGSELEGSMTATQKELAELRKQHAEAEKRLAAFRALTARFQKMIDAGKISVLFRNGQMIMKLPSGILFASGRADLSTEGQGTLSEVATILKEFSDRKFLIAGHTDNVPLPRHGRFKDNWELSTARALTVARYLVKDGVNSQSLGAAGYAEFDPVAANDAEAGRQENRRIEIVVVPNISEMPRLPEEAKPAS
jgi:chemotaxis protein MotB